MKHSQSKTTYMPVPRELVCFDGHYGQFLADSLTRPGFFLIRFETERILQAFTESFSAAGISVYEQGPLMIEAPSKVLLWASKEAINTTPEMSYRMIGAQRLKLSLPNWVYQQGGE
ncbi:MAG: hypothetical protein V3T17_02805 [Pseudomonadales bacterium]